MNPTFQSIIYLLCFITSAACAALLVRSYLANRARLILWTALSFVFLALNNLFLVLDVLLLPSVDLLPLRQLASLSAVSVLLFGFVWDVD
jgi:hypothetical protein